MKKIILSMMILGVLSLSGCKNGTQKSENQNAEAAPTAQVADTTQAPAEPQLAFNPDSVAQEPVFDIVTTKGTIRVKLYSDTPKHRANFIRLASERYFDNMLFHRVIQGFMIQTGDPYTKNPDIDPVHYGTGSLQYTVPAEILPQHKHKKGALAAARKGDAANPQKASSSTQFYLVQDASACAQLDGEYTVYGETISGLDVIDAIAGVPTGAKKRDLPNTDIRILRVELVKE